jgi:flagellar basal body rod protein FlgG
MDVSLYSAAAAMNATERWQDLVADNLSSSSVPGARQQEMSFSSVQAGMSSIDSGAANQSYVIPFAAAATNFSQGELKATGNNLDMALEGPGFFSVQKPDGSKAYTRDGEFELNNQGQLVTKQGYPVSSSGGTLTFDPNNTAPIAVSTDGQVSQGGDVKGSIAVTEFANMKGVSLGAGGYFQSNDTISQPKTSTTTSVRQGFVEESNTSPTLAMASLLTSMRMFESNQKVMEMQSDRMSKTISDLSGTT